MLRVRVIPVLLLDDASLVKTVRFRKPRYIGDPCNTVRIFNELEVDELAFLDITATREGRPPNFLILSDIATECFMPLSYGGGITTYDQAARIFSIGFEKVIVNSGAFARPELISEIAKVYGTQAVVASIDVDRGCFGDERVRSHGARRTQRVDPVEWAIEMEHRGAGEILLTAINREGMWDGYEIDLIRRVSDAVHIPVIANGGASGIPAFVSAVRSGASSVAAGSIFVFQKKDFGVLVSFPEHAALEEAFA